MKANQFENTNKLFERIKTVNFWQRIFSWINISGLVPDAYAEFKSIDKEFQTLSEKNDKDIIEINGLKKDIEHNKEKVSDLKGNIKILEDKNNNLLSKNQEFEKEISGHEKVEKKKQEVYEHKVTELNSLKEQMDKDRKQLQDEREKEIEQHFEDMKETWKNHEDMVEQDMRQICKRGAIDYIDKENVPFKGKPDNTIKIVEEFIIFDAKSPANDNLENFPSYIKGQAESLKKYIKEERVKKDIFLVVPTNTIETLDSYFYDLGDYSVYVITRDSLEPIILSLRKIEDYEFAEKLSPEDRDEVCRVIGKFAHTTKRRLQIDSFFAGESIALLKNCENLPEEILDNAVKYELGAILNPPMDKRSKKIDIKKLKATNNRTKKELEIHNVNTKVRTEQIDKIELYKKKKK